MKKVSQFFLLIFFIITVSVPIYWLTKRNATPEVSIIEARILELPEKSYPTLMIALEYIRQGNPELAIELVWDLFTGGSLQDKFDSAATDQYPMRIPIIKFSKSIERQIIQLSYGFLGDTIIPADMTSGLYIVLEHDALIFPPRSLENDCFINIDERIENYRNIIRAFPNINIYVYFLETLEFSQYHPINNQFSRSDRGQSFNYFSANLPGQINLGVLNLESFNDHMVNYYRTDHHWNTNGMLLGYNGIYELLSINYEDIPNRLTPSTLITFPGIEFSGTFARKTLYPIRGDDFVGFEADFPACNTYNNGIKGVFDHREMYLAGNYSIEPYTSHYELYFGTQDGLLEYDCETFIDRNILVFGDSFTRPLIPLIATHYKHTYYVDLRQETDFSMSEFLNEHQVEDMLIVGDNDVLFFDTERWKIHP